MTRSYPFKVNPPVQGLAAGAGQPSLLVAGGWGSKPVLLFPPAGGLLAQGGGLLNAFWVDFFDIRFPDSPGAGCRSPAGQQAGNGPIWAAIWKWPSCWDWASPIREAVLNYLHYHR